MEELKKQLDILIDRAEEKRQLEMLRGLSSDMRESTGEINAFKLIKLLIDTNLSLTSK